MLFSGTWTALVNKVAKDNKVECLRLRTFEQNGESMVKSVSLKKGYNYLILNF